MRPPHVSGGLACGSLAQGNVSWPQREPHRRPQWGCPHASPPPIPAHPSHVSWPQREPHRRPQWQGSHAWRANVGTPLTRFVCPQGAPPKAPVAGLACVTAPILAHPSHGAWPHSEHSETTPYPHEFLNIPKIWNDDLTKSGCFWCDAPTPRSMLVRCVRRRPAAVQRGVVVGPPWPVRVCFFGARCASASSVPSGTPACRGLDFER